MAWGRLHEVEIKKLENERYEFLAECKTCGWQARTHLEEDIKVAVQSHINIRKFREG